LIVAGQQTDSTQSAHKEVAAAPKAGVSATDGLHSASLNDMKQLNQTAPRTADGTPHLSIVDSSGLPQKPADFESSPWNQPVLEKAGGLAGILGGKTTDTVGGVLEKRAVAGLSDSDRAAYDKEEKALQRSISGLGSHPVETPEHTKVANLVAQQQKNAEQTTLNSMSPADQQKYLAAKQQYETANADFDKSGGTKPFPVMPPEVAAFNGAVAKTAGVDTGDAPPPITQTSRTAPLSEPIMGTRGNGVDSSGLPQKPADFESSPWNQPVLEKAPGLAGILGFQSGDTVGGVLEKRAVAGLSDSDRAAYEKEEKALQRSISGLGSHPVDTPEHTKVANLVAQQEKNAEQTTLNSMSPADQQKYLTAKQQYEAANADFDKSGGAKPFPEMPPEVAAFNAAVAKTVSVDTGDAPPTATQTARTATLSEPIIATGGGNSLLHFSLPDPFRLYA
jgi:hypothetical protein